MKTAIIISDTHGNRAAVQQLKSLCAENDYLIHLGDGSFDLYPLLAEFPDKIYRINGNCDFPKTGEDETILDIEGVKIFATHGHIYSAKTTLTRLSERAKELGCTVVLYGHTHRAREDEIDGITLINPGTMSRYSEQSYTYMTAANGKAIFKNVAVKTV